MNSKLILTSTLGMSREQWLAFRKRGVGGSDVPTIMGMNPYKAEIELWYEKLSLIPELTIENIAMFGGKRGEDLVAEDYWPYWAGTEESVIENYNAGKVIRKCQRVNAYIQNPDYPWLFVSLDRKINRHGGKGEGVLEIKNTSGYEQDKWESGIPPSNLLQVTTQIFVTILEYGELAILRDGRKFDVFDIEKRDKIFQSIVVKTKKFWDTVIEGRKILTQKYEAIQQSNKRLADELQAQLELLEPEPDGSEAYEKFLKTKFRKSIAEAGLVKGTDEQYEMALAHKNIKEQMKKLTDNARDYENRLKRVIGDGTAIDFGKGGRVSWAGEPKRFANKIII